MQLFPGRGAIPGPPLPCWVFMTEHLIGVISDTHGLLRPQAVQALEGVELIIHAGDIGDPKILPRPGTDRPGARGPGQHRPGRLGPRTCPPPSWWRWGASSSTSSTNSSASTWTPPPPVSMRSSSATPILPTWNAKTASSTSTPAAPDRDGLPCR